MGVEAGQQVFVLLAGAAPALVGEGQQERHCRIAEREGGGPGHGARHVGDAVVHDPFDLVDRILMRGGARGFEATALIDGDIDDGGAGFHGLQLFARDQFRGGGAGDEHGTDDQIGGGDLGRGGGGAGI